MNKLKKLFLFIAVNVFLIALLAVLVIGGFMIAGEISSITMVTREGFSARVDYILTNGDKAKLNDYFTKDFLLLDDTAEARLAYSRFRLSRWNTKIEMDNAWCWPWQTKVTVTVRDHVPFISGTLPDENMTDAERLSGEEILPPEWNGCEWRVSLVKENGYWKISKAERVRYLPQPSNEHAHTVSPEG